MVLRTSKDFGITWHVNMVRYGVVGERAVLKFVAHRFSEDALLYSIGDIAWHARHVALTRMAHIASL